jgi:hypothetical protein
VNKQLIEAHVIAVLQQRLVKVIASCVKASSGNVSGLISAVMVIQTVKAELMRRIAVSISYLYKIQNKEFVS